jgi:hypothetical protein
MQEMDHTFSLVHNHLLYSLLPPLRIGKSNDTRYAGSMQLLESSEKRRTMVFMDWDSCH